MPKCHWVESTRVPGYRECSVCRTLAKPSKAELEEAAGVLPECGTRSSFAPPRVEAEATESPTAVALTAAAAELGLTYARRYAKAITKWVAAGKPKRSDEEVARILAICQSNECGKYAVNALIGGRCTVCGCRVNSSQMALANKIRMATEECPQQRWKQES